LYLPSAIHYILYLLMLLTTPSRCPSCFHSRPLHLLLFLCNDPSTTEIYTLSLHDALPIWKCVAGLGHLISRPPSPSTVSPSGDRSEEHTSELQSRFDLVCRLLLEKKK